MKKLTTLLICLFLIPFSSLAQTLEDIDYISPFHNGVAAVQKGEQWGFINEDGTIAIKFRKDLVITKTDNEHYPLFRNERCLITANKEGISYFGYIDKSGKTVIQPQFLNAGNFNNEAAFALELVKNDLGENVLGKSIVTYDYFEVLINNKGEVLNYLSTPNRITLTKKHLRHPPTITSHFISDYLVATKNNSNKWSIKPVKKMIKAKDKPH